MSEYRIVVNLTVNAESREIVDRRINEVRHCVIPITSITIRNEPFVAGSAVILNYDSKLILLTAKHVLDDHSDEPLFYFDKEGYNKPLNGPFICTGEIDLVAKLLTESESSDLSHIKALDFTKLSEAEKLPARFYGSVVGYPATQAKMLSKSVIDTRMTVWSNKADLEDGGSVAVWFDKKEGGKRDNQHVRPPDPYGMSGGAIFGMKLIGLNAVEDASPIFMGVATDWDRKESKVMRGPGRQIVEQLVEQCMAESSDSLA